VSNRERRKGRDGETEVRHLLARHGLVAHPLGGREDQADALIVVARERAVLLEVKRQETARVWAWWEQASDNAGQELPVVAFRRSRSPWLCLLPLEDLAALLAESRNGG
jgi:hypothetical protein